MKASTQAGLESRERIPGRNPGISQQQFKRIAPMQGACDRVVFTRSKLATNPSRR
jgi:hypothetical protein